MQTARQNKVRREAEKDKHRKFFSRLDKTKRIAEKNKDRISKQNARQNMTRRIAERESNRNLKRIARQNMTKRIADRDRNRKLMRIARQNATRRLVDRNRNCELMRIARQNTTKRIAERCRDRRHKRTARQDPAYKEKEKERNNLTKREQRNCELFKYRENLQHKLRRSDTNVAKIKLEFVEARSTMPDKICCCCEGLFFPHSVVNYDAEKLRAKLPQGMLCAVFNIASPTMCTTCYKSVNMKKVPKLSTSNGLKFPDVPDIVKSLSSLEERMVSPYIPFMQIRPLMTYAVNGQLGMKGSVVNISIEIDDAINVLPRQFNEMQTIQVKLKRHMDHKTDYMFETIRPSNVCGALKYLLETPLYKKYGINANATYFAEYEDKQDEVIDFVVDKNDLTDKQNGPVEKDDHEAAADADGDVEVLVIDHNAQNSSNEVKIIAPGQGKKPVPWHSVPDLDELCFPKIFAGHPMNITVSYSDRAKSECRRYDRRSCEPTRLLFMAKKKLEKACLSAMNVCLRQTRKDKNINAGQALNQEYIDDMCKLDQGYRFV